MSILMDGERILCNQDDIANHVLNYYTDLFGSTNNIAPNDLIQSMISSLDFDDENLMFTSIPSHQEIKDVVFGLNGDGAPGPDGFGGCFYQDFWDIVGNDIITKVLVDRLSIIAPKIISPQQRGFIRDRKIQECICLASEAINLLDHKTFGGNMAIKLDIKKAFDTIDWDFITSTLTAFGFSMHFTNLIKVILSSSRLSFCVNGHMVGFTNCSRGVRQGDPLSPPLFCIVEDVFSRGIMKLVNDRKLSPISSPNMLQTPSHVLHADDIMIFCKGTKSNLLALKSLIQDYSSASGKHISADKCKFYIKNAPARKVSNISNYLGFQQGSLPFNYLGVSLFTGKPKKCQLQPIADKILLKLSAWKGSLLSIMGRVELVISICQSMLVYSFHVYKLPAQLLKGVDSKMRNFIWSGNTEAQKIVTVAWNQVCSSTSVGGLGLKFIKLMNKSALLKLAWDSSDSILTTKLAYDSLSHSNSPNHWRNNIWFNSIPHSRSFITWRLLNGKMPTNDNLQKRGWYMGSMCSLCRSNTEGSSHLFLTCPFAIYLWNWLGSHMAIFIDTSSVTALFSICNNSWSKQMNEMLYACII
ncbi:PREDICTED: uncharacterized protein LOC109339236 [Lupinus angustifolius]|uniref:uncharacterized protein LOC109339236 n=1 Tax=Lupinus angustifolius TaxID=3871 RepID=UPI00092FBBAC|nr:PREDICTED: uncharacterized protein LOC109339236 [Lupinus angustifolius]